MRNFVFGSFILCSFVLAACMAPDGAEQANESSSELAASELKEAQVREAFLSDHGQVMEKDYGSPGAASLASASFWQTCLPYKYYVVSSTGRIIEAYSDSCRRRNGTYGGPTFWSGSCSSDIANCNGVLKCGPC